MCGNGRTFIRRQGGFHTRKACNSLRPAGPTGYRCISSGTAISARTSKKRSLGINHIRAFHIPMNGASRTSAEREVPLLKQRKPVASVSALRAWGFASALATPSLAAETGRSMKYTGRPVYEIPACAGMKCRRVAPARNTRAVPGYEKKAYQARPDTLFQVWRRGELNPCPGHC